MYSGQGNPSPVHLAYNLTVTPTPNHHQIQAKTEYEEKLDMDRQPQDQDVNKMIETYNYKLHENNSLMLCRYGDDGTDAIRVYDWCFEIDHPHIFVNGRTNVARVLSTGGMVLKSSHRQAKAHVELCDEKQTYLQDNSMTCKELFNLILTPLEEYASALRGEHPEDDIEVWPIQQGLHAIRSRARKCENCCWNHVHLTFAYE